MCIDVLYVCVSALPHPHHPHSQPFAEWAWSATAAVIHRRFKLLQSLPLWEQPCALFSARLDCIGRLRCRFNPPVSPFPSRPSGHSIAIAWCHHMLASGLVMHATLLRPDSNPKQLCAEGLPTHRRLSSAQSRSSCDGHRSRHTSRRVGSDAAKVWRSE